MTDDRYYKIVLNNEGQVSVAQMNHWEERDYRIITHRKFDSEMDALSWIVEKAAHLLPFLDSELKFKFLRIVTPQE